MPRSGRYTTRSTLSRADRSTDLRNCCNRKCHRGVERSRSAVNGKWRADPDRRDGTNMPASCTAVWIDYPNALTVIEPTDAVKHDVGQQPAIGLVIRGRTPDSILAVQSRPVEISPSCYGHIHLPAQAAAHGGQTAWYQGGSACRRSLNSKAPIIRRIHPGRSEVKLNLATSRDAVAATSTRDSQVLRRPDSRLVAWRSAA